MHKTHQPCASLHQLSATKHIGKHCQTLIGTWVLHGTATVTVINIKKNDLAESGNLCCRLSPHSQGVPSHWNPIYHGITRAGWVKTSSTIQQLRKCRGRCQKSWNRSNMRNKMEFWSLLDDNIARHESDISLLKSNWESVCGQEVKNKPV
jgi:hypothetical protein